MALQIGGCGANDQLHRNEATGNHTLFRRGTDAKAHTGPLVFARRALAGSLIGGIAETQEMLDFCGQHGITSDIEIVRIQDINEAYGRLLKADVKYRFVIDMASLQQA